MVTIFREFDKDHGGSLSSDEMQTAMSQWIGNLSEEEWNAIMKTFDQDGDGEISFKELFGAIREYKARKRRGGVSARAHERSPHELVRQFTRGRWTDPALARQYSTRRTNVGSMIQKYRPPTVKVPQQRPGTVSRPAMHYSDYTGTAGGTKWYLIGTGQPEGRKGLQPNPDRTLFKGGHTLAELFKNNKPERAQPSKEASGDSHKRRRRPAGCSGFVAPRSVPPPARPTTVDPTTITQSSRRRPDALAKPHGRPRTVFDGDRRKSVQSRSYNDALRQSHDVNPQAFTHSATTPVIGINSTFKTMSKPLRHPIDRKTYEELMQKSKMQDPRQERVGRPSLRLALGGSADYGGF